MKTALATLTARDWSPRSDDAKAVPAASSPSQSHGRKLLPGQRFLYWVGQHDVGDNLGSSAAAGSGAAASGDAAAAGATDGSTGGAGAGPAESAAGETIGSDAAKAKKGKGAGGAAKGKAAAGGGDEDDAAVFGTAIPVMLTRASAGKLNR